TDAGSAWPAVSITACTTTRLEMPAWGTSAETSGPDESRIGGSSTRFGLYGWSATGVIPGTVPTSILALTKSLRSRRGCRWTGGIAIGNTAGTVTVCDSFTGTSRSGGGVDASCGSGSAMTTTAVSSAAGVPAGRTDC